MTSDHSKPSASKKTLLKHIPKDKQIKFQSDPAKIYLFFLVRHGCFESVTELKDFVLKHNSSLDSQLDEVLKEMEELGWIDLGQDTILSYPDGVYIGTGPSDAKVFSEFSKLVTLRAFSDRTNHPEKTKLSSGFDFFALSANKDSLSKAKAIYERYKADMRALAAVHYKNDSPNFLVVCIARACPGPEDF